MNASNQRDLERPQRRRIIALIAATGALWPVMRWVRPPLAEEPPRRELGLREVDFYRPHDLAG